MAITGGCLCGAVRYSIAASKPLVTRQCWCRLCQYLGGGSSTVNAGFQSADFTVTGELARHEAVADSGNPMVRSFCPACGTPMFSETPARPHLRFIRVGTLDDTRSEEHTSELQSLMRISYDVFCLKKKRTNI